MQPPNHPAARDERGPATVRRERLTLDDLRQRAVGAEAEAEARRQQEKPDRGAARTPAQRDQVLIDREVALSKAVLLREWVHGLLERTQQECLDAATDRRAPHPGRLPAEERRHGATTARPAAARASDDPAAERDQREIERNMVQPPDERAE